MNRMFRVIWSRAAGAWVVASELSTRCGKGGQGNDRRQAVVAGVGAAAVALCCWSSPASAQAWKGTTSSDWTVGSNWSTGTAPTGAATVTINTNSPSPTVLGVSGPATATIGTLYLSGVAAATPNTFTSTLIVQNGSTLSSGASNIGFWDVNGSAVGSATATVTGTGSSWSATSVTIGTGNSSGITGRSAPGTLNIANGATVNVAGAMILGQSSGSGTLNVTSGGTLTTGNATMFDLGANTVNTANISGAGSKWSVAGTFLVGNRASGTAGTSTLNVANGGAVAATGDITLGGTNLSTGGHGDVTVTGSGSQLSTSGALNIGFWGKGSTVTVSNGAVATANSVTITPTAALAAFSTGTLNLSSSGTLATQTLTAGAGTAQVNFDGATLRATASNTAFIGGFTGTELNIAAGGVNIDTGSFTDTAASPFTGVGALTKVGTGTLVMIGNNSYAGSTTISAGTLQLGNGGTSGSISGDVVNNGTLVFDRSDISTFGGAISGTGAVNQIGTGTTILTGNNTYAGGTTISAGALQLGNGGASGSVTGNVTNNGALIIDRSDVNTYGGQISGSGAVSLIGTGTTILTANNAYTGGTTVSAGTLAIGDASHPQATSGSGNVSVASGAALGGYGQITGSVQNDGTLAAANALPVFTTGSTGTLRIGGSLTNNGVLQLAAANGNAGNVLQVAGNYGGNGQLVLNTVLNQGGAASQTDQLIVGGNASGSTAITLNRSGSGAQTVGDGIQVVRVGGTSAANSFRLAGPIQAGAYQYLLYQGGATDSNSWYLRSQFEQTTPTAGAGASVLPATSGASAAVAAAVAYRPAVIGYSVTPLLNADYGFSVLGRQQERVGDEASAAAAQPAHSNGVWGRIGGQNLDADAGNRFSADERTFFAQFGKDWTLAHGANGGSTHAGATVTFGSTSASFSDSLRSLSGLSNATGTVETQAQSLGGYWTRYLPDGSYVDGVGQLTHYHNRYGDAFGGSASQNGFGAGMSGEVGKPFALGATGVAIEPQAQLLYQYLHLNGFDDGISQVAANSTNGLRGRLGFRLFKANLSNDSKTSTVTPWLTADVLHDFLSPGQTLVGGTALNNRLGKTWCELGVGVTGTFGKRSTLYADVRYAHNLGGDYRRTVFGQAGYRFNW
ncbi:autotransporter outer membrane beta-barrel domain-containing protein [Trinickia sp.]|uniref:autotransporter outer membrane beta-barrel domain-containing protein n=1 Tax=Trinickia sp. TaxID=2571163 RepID=UPI003F819823